MVFSSVVFLFFFLPLVLAIGLLLQGWANRSGGRGVALRFANAWLVFASLVFYAWGEVRLLWVLLLSGALSFAGGLAIARTSGRPRWLTLGAFVAALLAPLAWFKYAALAADFFNRLNAFAGHPFEATPAFSGIVLPLGISFFTFHGVSYVVDVYRGTISPTRRPLDFACYFTLFPQLVAGPIVRFAEVAQFFDQRQTRIDEVADGARRFIVGLGKKVLIANQVSVLADATFALSPADQTGGSAWLGAIAYALQIYFDFSGYSDMAIGLGRMLGFTFPENFNHPYAAGSVRDFWRRWHMTLSRFFRDYLYFPLGGNRLGPARTSLNLVVVFALCGLWHGASWNFLFWGLFHGFFLASERLLQPATDRSPSWLRPLGHAYTLAVVLFAWVLFRCDTWPQARAIWRAMFDFKSLDDVAVLPWQALASDTMLAFLVGVLFSTPTASWVRSWIDRTALGRIAGPPLASAAAICILAMCALSVGAGSHNPFIYFRF